MTAWLTKRRAALGLLLPSLAVVILGSRPWVTGRTSDVVLAGRGLTVTGDQAAPGLVALGLVAVAASVAVLTTGRRLRQVSSVLLTLAALGALALTVGVLRDPSAALSAGSGPGAVGAASATPGSLTPWPWSALLAAVLTTVLGALSLPAGRGWEGLSSRFERPSTPDAAQGLEPGAGEGAGEERTHAPDLPPAATAWDALSEGHDPTDDDPATT
ncbi:Trp biosynthesis-associated membrane protein [Dermatophilaceae bacterium Soc4.6]